MILITSVVILSVIVGCGSFSGTLTIINNSGEILEEVVLIYNQLNQINQEIQIGTLEDGDNYVHQINDDIGEASISLTFIDEQGNRHTEIIVGYVHKGISSSQIKIIKIGQQFDFIGEN